MSDTDTIARRAALGRIVGAGVAGAAGLLIPCPAQACELTFKPGQVRADATGRATFEAFIFIEHRRCVISLPPECVHVAPVGLRILRQTGWTRAKHDMYRCEFEVQLDGAQGSLRIWRDCAKKGISAGAITISRGGRP
jgi:hypothetical protein